MLQDPPDAAACAPLLRLALVADDSKKQELVELLRTYLPLIRRTEITVTTGSGSLAVRWLGLPNTTINSPARGGCQQVGAKVASGDIDAVFLFRAIGARHPWDCDVTALQRLCDVCNIPVATNPSTAALILEQRAARPGDACGAWARVAAPKPAAPLGAGRLALLVGEFGND
jgi:methylglyoxal synthase